MLLNVTLLKMFVQNGSKGRLPLVNIWNLVRYVVKFGNFSLFSYLFIHFNLVISITIIFNCSILLIEVEVGENHVIWSDSSFRSWNFVWDSGSLSIFLITSYESHRDFLSSGESKRCKCITLSWRTEIHFLKVSIIYLWYYINYFLLN